MVFLGAVTLAALALVTHAAAMGAAVLLPAFFFAWLWRERKHHMLAVPGGRATLRVYDDRVELEHKDGLRAFALTNVVRSEDLPAAPVHVGNFKIRVRPEASLVLISQSERENVVLTPRMFDSFEEFATFTREILPALPQRFDLASQAGEPTDHAVYRARLRDDLEKMDGLD
ncbi:MAG: hypothetical protein JNK45_28480 [Myxococcales bacterium]|nr:hypothetical protein [Myxococcales bacterium]